jgi:hypothetical protein
MNIIQYKLIDNYLITINDDELLYNKEKFYIQTPVMESGEIIKHGEEYYIQFNFKDIPTHNLFLESLKYIEKTVINNDNSFTSFFLRDIHDNISIKVGIESMDVTFFNKDKGSILGSEIFKKTKCIGLIYMNSSRKWILHQYMKL